MALFRSEGPATDTMSPEAAGTSRTVTGTCFCGGVVLEATGEPEKLSFCHCASCRAYSGTPVATFILWKANRVRVARGAELVGSFNKSGISDRQFCTRCGGHLKPSIPAWASPMSTPLCSPLCRSSRWCT